MTFVRTNLVGELKQDPDYQSGNVWQAMVNLAMDLWEEDPKLSYPNMLERCAGRWGDIVKLATVLGKYHGQVCNGGHQQYWDNGYASEGGGCFAKHDPSCPTHQEMIIMFGEYELVKLKQGDQVLDIMLAFKVDEQWDEQYGGDPYLEVTDASLDDKYYALLPAWEQTINQYLMDSLTQQ